jgi:hypothetical protein
MPIASACPGVGLGLKYLLLGVDRAHVKVEFTTVEFMAKTRAGRRLFRKQARESSAKNTAAAVQAHGSQIAVKYTPNR